MKRTFRTMLAMMAGALALCACSREEITEVPTARMMTFTALQESSEQTKTALDQASGTQVLWSLGDKVSYFGGGKGEYLTLTKGEGTTEGTFTGMVTATGDDYVLYPHSPSASCSNGTIKVYIPSIQSVPAGGFDPSAALMVAKVKADGSYLQFRNAVGLLAITIPEGETSISKMVISGNDNERIAGLVAISGISATGAPTVTGTRRTWESDGSGASTDGVKYIEVTPAEEGNFKPGCTYHVAVAPDAALSKGIYVLLYNGTTATPSMLKLAVKKSNSNIGMARNKIRVTTLPAVAAADWQGMIELGSANGEGALYMAPFNLGATSSEGTESYGSHYSFGEVDTKGIYNSTKYRSDANLSAKKKTDAATANWGPDWRMPTLAELKANNESQTYRERLSAALPLSGCYVVSSLEDAGRLGDYWASTGNSGNEVTFFRKSGSSLASEYGSKVAGRSVRPVMADRKPDVGAELWASAEAINLREEGNERSAFIYGTVDFETEILGNEDGWFKITISDAESDKAPFAKKVSVSTEYLNDIVYKTCSIRYYNSEFGLCDTLKIDQDIPYGIAVISADTIIPKEGGDFAIVTGASGNAEKQVKLPSWIKQVDTKSVAFDTLYVRVDPTPYRFDRMSTIEITAKYGRVTYLNIRQEGDDTKSAIPDDEIWYTMKSDHIIDFSRNWATPFDRSVLSVTYEDGMGKIKFDGPVKNIFEYAFDKECMHFFDDEGINTVHDVYLPDCVETIGMDAFSGSDMEKFYLPANLKSVNYGAFWGCGIKKFIGDFTTPDGTGLVIGDVFYTLAPGYDGETYTVPDGIVSLARGSFGSHGKLKEVILPEGLKVISDDTFSYCDLKYVTIPSSVEQIGYNAFNGNRIKEFRGNSKFISDDHLFLTDKYPLGDGMYIMVFANGCGKESYVIPEGIQAVDSQSFADNPDLKYLTIPKSFIRAHADAFIDSHALCGLFGEHVSSDNKSLIVDNELQFTVPNGVEHLFIDSPVDKIGANSITFNNDLKSIVINDNVARIGDYAFSYSRGIESITLPAGLVSLGHDPFFVCSGLKDVWVRAVDPPTTGDIYMADYNSDLKFHVPEESLERYKNSVYWQKLKDRIVGCKYTDLPGSTSSHYASTDYSADGRVKTLQKATRGKGIDIVLMGDAYTDAMIADGTYDYAMNRMLEALFVEEPFKSYRDCFNVYQVDVVSKNGLIADDALTALNSKFAGGTKVEAGHNAVQAYASKAISDLSNALIVVVLNEYYRLGGTCYMYDGKAGKYGAGLSICYFSDIKDQHSFESLVNHEAMGHGFAKLGDEYAYESYGTYVPGLDSRLAYNETMGWFKNIDDEGDAATIKWARLLADKRYEGTGLGIFEGGYTYWKGIYRPTEYSVMRYNEGGFNAPSREAAWCRIQYLSNGESWTYDYEDFVAYDAINRKKASQSAAKARTAGRYVMKPAEHCPPVMMGALK